MTVPELCNAAGVPQGSRYSNSIVKARKQVPALTKHTRNANNKFFFLIQDSLKPLFAFFSESYWSKTANRDGGYEALCSGIEEAARAKGFEVRFSEQDDHVANARALLQLSESPAREDNVPQQKPASRAPADVNSSYGLRKNRRRNLLNNFEEEEEEEREAPRDSPPPLIRKRKERSLTAPVTLGDLDGLMRQFRDDLQEHHVQETAVTAYKQSEEFKKATERAVRQFVMERATAIEAEMQLHRAEKKAHIDAELEAYRVKRLGQMDADQAGLNINHIVDAVLHHVQ
jgi:hypothetical protein